MPREMHIRSLDGTRWTSTSSAATLKAPHGGMRGLGCACGCKSCGNGMQGLSGCGCGARQRVTSPRQPLGLGAVGPTQIDTLKPNERTLLSISAYLYGQPPLGADKIVAQTLEQLHALGYATPKMSDPQVFPLAWSWAWEAKPKVWTAYVSNPDAGPFKQLLNIEGSSFFLQKDITPAADSTKNYPTQGVLLTFDVLPATDTVSPAELGQLREALRKVGLQGTGVRMFVHVKGVPKKSNWFWGLLALGGVAYASSKL